MTAKWELRRCSHCGITIDSTYKKCPHCKGRQSSGEVRSPSYEEPSWLRVVAIVTVGHFALLFLSILLGELLVSGSMPRPFANVIGWVLHRLILFLGFPYISMIGEMPPATFFVHLLFLMMNSLLWGLGFALLLHLVRSSR